MLTDVGLEKAQELLLNHIMPLAARRVSLEQALGRVMAGDFFSPANLPPYSQAAVDGYALHSHDLAMGQALIDKDFEAHQPDAALQPGRTVRVLTGRPLPADSSAVIAQELVKIKGDTLYFPAHFPSGSNIKQPGEDFGTGDLVARGGTSIDPGLIGVLAALGQTEVAVHPQPRVIILSLAGEVVPYHATPRFGQVRDCNGPLLASLVAAGGGQVETVHLVGSESKEEVKELIEKMIHRADLVLTIGRTAVGSDDYAPALLRELGAGVLFWGVRIKPGSHSGAALLEEKPVISLSGNPAACAVGYHLLADPVLRTLQGLNPTKYSATAILKDAFPRKGGPRCFLRGHATLGDDGLTVSLLPGQKSSMLRSLIRWNALIELPAGHAPVEPGTKVSVILLPAARHSMGLTHSDFPSGSPLNQGRHT